MLLLLVACAPTSPIPDGMSFREGEILLRIAGDDVDEMDVDDEHGLVEADRIEAIGVRRVLIPEGKTVASVVEKLSEDHRVAFAEPNQVVYALATDTYRSYQWNFADIDVEGAWAHGNGTGVKVAVLDTGVRSGGPDGIASLLPGYDFANGDSNPSDSDGHGTFVAGTIAQKTNNGVGVAGVAPGASILPVKVLGDDGAGDIAAIANGLVWATDQGAKVANLSLGSPYASSTLERACTYAYDRGVTVVAASGNEYASSVGYPAAYSTVIAVGATGYGGVRAGYSNTGRGLDLVAPGGNLEQDANRDGYADGILQETIEGGSWTYTFWEGTSMAAPHVSAVAALVIAQGVTSPADVFRTLTETARDGGSAGYDTSYGWGSLDAGAAVARAAGGGATPTPPTDGVAPTISAVTGWTDGSDFTIEWTTDEPADTYLNFRSYGAVGEAELVTSHSLTLTGQAGATYYFTVRSADAAGNVAETAEYYVKL